MPEILINKRYGGMSETDTLMSDGQFVYTESVDGKSTPEYLQLGRKIENLIDTGTYLMNAVVEITQSVSFFFGQGGKVYSSSGNNVYTLPGGYTIYNAIKFGNRIIFFYEQSNTIKLATITIANANPTSWNPGDVTVNYGTFSPAIPANILGPYCPALNFSEDILYFAAGNRVYIAQFPSLPFFESNVVFEDQVVGLTRNGPLINIYLANGRKYFWNGFDKTVEGYVELGDQISYVFNDKNYDYIRAGGAPIYAKLFLSQGQSFQLLKSSRYWTEGSSPFPSYKFAYYTTPYGNYTMASDKSNIYLFNQDNGGLESFGNIIAGLPKGSNYETTKASNGLAMVNNGFIYNPLYTGNDQVWWSYEDSDGNCGINYMWADRYDNTTYQLSGKVVTKKYDFGAPMQYRPIEYKFRCDTPAGTSIVVEYAIDGGGFQNLKTLTGSDKRPRVIRNNDTSSIINTPFYEIQWRITLTSNSDTVTPKLYSMMMSYEQIAT